jgi:hypothetical protein
MSISGTAGFPGTSRILETAARHKDDLVPTLDHPARHLQQRDRLASTGYVATIIAVMLILPMGSRRRRAR